jgi:transcriptional regulator with XRE-family HTH domain
MARPRKNKEKAAVKKVAAKRGRPARKAQVQVEGLGGMLRELRAKKNLSQKGAAIKAGVHPVYYSQIESGKHIPSQQILDKLAVLYGVSADVFPVKGKKGRRSGSKVVDVKVETGHDLPKMISRLDTADRKIVLDIIGKMLTIKKFKEILN